MLSVAVELEPLQLTGEMEHTGKLVVVVSLGLWCKFLLSVLAKFGAQAKQNSNRC